MPTDLADDLLCLRIPVADDATAATEAVRSSLVELMRWTSWCHADYSVADVEKSVRKVADERFEDRAYSFYIHDGKSGASSAAVACIMSIARSIAPASGTGYAAITQGGESPRGLHGCSRATAFTIWTWSGSKSSSPVRISPASGSRKNSAPCARGSCDSV